MDNQVMLKLIASIKRHEGLRKHPYVDSTGHISIGYGRNLKDNGISESEADIMLHNDIINSSMELYRFLPWTQSLDDVRKSVLIELTFNCGIEGVLSFKSMLDALKDHNYPLASQELLKSKYAEQVGQRAHDLAYAFEVDTL